ncbi:Apolipoprotein L3 [Anabarilius grahami]|uniref:Apolipoprotein L3 n=1 Tax=Anabarilius grahami TaxID=495550 RepID=A0A3N0Z4H7_ANAGA|nr:Apolipoprotein L3 [Anabarilius grahami]
MRPKDWLNLDEEKGEEGRSGLATTTQSQYRVMKQALFRAGPAVMIAQERGRLGSITLVFQSNNLCSLSRCTKLPQEQIVSDHILLQTHWDYSGEMASAVLLPGSGSFITADESSLSAADNMQRHILHAVSMTGNPPPISERYSEELRELISQMLSRDPKDRPSAEEILAKPFLTDAVDRNSRTPEALLQRFKKSISTFDEAYNKHYKDIEVLVSEWGKITDSMESAHYSATAGSLSGSVIGAAGGITALVGLILAPFTLGASLIVTGVGVGVGVAGGVTGSRDAAADDVTAAERIK